MHRPTMTSPWTPRTGLSQWNKSHPGSSADDWQEASHQASSCLLAQEQETAALSSQGHYGDEAIRDDIDFADEKAILKALQKRNREEAEDRDFARDANQVCKQKK